MDHNHLRITRIIRSLRILGLEAEALAFYHVLITVAEHASESSKGYWKRAAIRNLNVSPDDMRAADDDMTVGKAFLIKYEEGRKEDKKDKSTTGARIDGNATSNDEELSGQKEDRATEDGSESGPPAKRSRKM